ncbi:MAG: GNAT family N-acetyltransferase [Eubacteriaceae bacterium]|nr:GNAT family N-acetyltransferase [Eubacteriaceae bacterium]
MKFIIADDAETVKDSYRDVTENTPGIEHTARWVYGKHPTDGLIDEYVKNGELYLLTEEGRILGMTALVMHQGDDYADVPWGTALEADQAATLHLLAVCPSYQRSGLGYDILRKAEELSVLKGKKALRLDVLASNVPARHMYEKAGYALRGQKRMYAENTGWTDFLFYEKILSPGGGSAGGDSSGASYPPPVFLSLEDTQWPLEYTDHDRQIVRAVAVGEDGYFYFVRAERDDQFGRATLIETSGGGVEPGEELVCALKRELREELGAEVRVVCEIGTVRDYYNLIHRHNINHYFLCRVISFGAAHLTQDEIECFHLRQLRLTFDEAIAEYERCSCTKIGKLIADRELPILMRAGEILRGIGDFPGNH